MNYHQTTGASDPLLPKAPDQRFAAVASLPIRVFRMDDMEWWAGESLAACVAEGRSQCGDDCYPDNPSEQYVFLSDAESFIEKAKLARRVRISATYFQHGDLMYEFRTPGLTWPPEPRKGGKAKRP